MKMSFRFIAIIAAFILISCGKSDDTNPNPSTSNSPNFYIGVRNNSDINSSCKTRQLVRVELSTSSGNSMETKFVLNPGESGLYSFTIAGIATYEIKVYTNEGQFVKWENIALEPNDKNGAMILGFSEKNSDYLEGCMLSGLKPSESTVDCN